MAFSLFLAPITNTSPIRDITLQDCCDYIRSNIAAARTMALRSASSPDEHDAIKRQQFDFVTFSGTFSTRKKDGLVQYSHLVCLDFDHVSYDAEDIKALKEQIATDETFPTLLAFVSPSGDGLKVVVSIACDVNEHEVAYAALSRYYREKYGLSADPQCKDIARACLLPYDPDAILKVGDALSPFDLRAYSGPSAPSIQPQQSTIKAVEDVIQQIESSRLDLTSNYDRWTSIGFALADEFGEAGRSFYHRVSQFYTGYSREETDKKFDDLLRTHNGAIGIGTFFFCAQEAGIRPDQNHKKKGCVSSVSCGSSDPQTIKKECGSNGSCGSSSDISPDFEQDPLLSQLPTIYEAVEKHLPAIIKDSVRYSRSERESDVRFLSSIAVISAALPGISGYYGGHQVYPHVYVVLDGPASSKKGKGFPAHKICQPIHDELLQSYTDAMKEYRLSNANKGAENAQDPDKPKRKSFFIPANSTESAMLNQIANNGGEGMIMEAELDTLSGIFKNKFGNYSPLLRKGTHHETISMRRRTNDEYVEIPCPRIALCIAGTPGQINSFIGSPENGLFSRIAFYCTSLDPEWESPWTPAGQIATEDLFKEIGQNYYCRYYSRLRQCEAIRFTLDRAQQMEFDRVFGDAKKEFLDEEGSSFIPSVHRMGLTCFRIAMILATLHRLEEGGEIPATLTCDEDSFIAAVEMATRLLEHSRFVFSHLPASTHGIHGRARAFFDALPKTFDRKEYLRVADELGMNPRTVERYLSRLIASNMLKNDYNRYTKIVTT